MKKCWFFFSCPGYHELSRVEWSGVLRGGCGPEQVYILSWACLVLRQETLPGGLASRTGGMVQSGPFTGQLGRPPSPFRLVKGAIQEGSLVPARLSPRTGAGQSEPPSPARSAGDLMPLLLELILLPQPQQVFPVTVLWSLGSLELPSS